jgi:hypothetical protein
MPEKLDSVQGETLAGELQDSFLLQQLGWFRGLQDPKDVVLDFIERELARREAGRVPVDPQSVARMKERLVKILREYMSVVIRMIGHTCDLASIEFAEEDLKVVQVRTDLDFHNWLVRALFVIDADTQKALQFRRILNNIEYAALSAERFTAELDYVNRRDNPPNVDSLRRRYPFVGRFRTKPVSPQEEPEDPLPARDTR